MPDIATESRRRSQRAPPARGGLAGKQGGLERSLPAMTDAETEPASGSDGIQRRIPGLERAPGRLQTTPSHLARRRAAVFLDVVVRRLEGFATLGPETIELLRGLDDAQTHPAGAELNCERAPLPKPRFLLTGWAARMRWLSDGRRQIMGFILPGEGIGLCQRPHPLALASTVALTPLTTIEAGPVMRALGHPETAPGLAEALRAAASMDEALLLDQIVRLGRQTAQERICHLLLELRDRMADVGLAHHQSFPLPLTQEVLADATGLSIVHVNRVLQQLRRERLLDLRAGRATLLDADQLAMIADYRRPQPSAWR
jgi:CRP-like cAMP-binding protein